MSQNFHSVPPVGEKQFVVTVMEKSQIFEEYENFKIEELNDDAETWVDVWGGGSDTKNNVLITPAFTNDLNGFSCLCKKILRSER